MPSSLRHLHSEIFILTFRTYLWFALSYITGKFRQSATTVTLPYHSVLDSGQSHTKNFTPPFPLQHPLKLHQVTFEMIQYTIEHLFYNHFIGGSPPFMKYQFPLYSPLFCQRFGGHSLFTASVFLQNRGVSKEVLLFFEFFTVFGWKFKETEMFQWVQRHFIETDVVLRPTASNFLKQLISNFFRTPLVQRPVAAKYLWSSVHVKVVSRQEMSQRPVAVADIRM